VTGRRSSPLRAHRADSPECSPPSARRSCGGRSTSRGPLPHVANHVEKAVAVRRKGLDRRGAFEAVLCKILPGKLPLPGIRHVTAAGVNSPPQANSALPASYLLGPPLSIVLTDWLSMTPAEGLAPRPAASRTCSSSSKLILSKTRCYAKNRSSTARLNSVGCRIEH
jgi:hypothetical protein